MNHLRIFVAGSLRLVVCMGVYWTTFALLRLITVRRLLRDPRTRNRLGLDIFAGWQTLNVATTLSWPRAAGATSTPARLPCSARTRRPCTRTRTCWTTAWRACAMGRKP